ncbi:TetR/AcrR family transcriptional regulator [Nocardiopsis sp. HNM0947]|uniref:TetR/AcrR family transcriptional regulator n=1 Tax=Nocardiopsis coralli TaxID=2772213 RepID=A0ABR9P262_9ACTN|nr:TetR/AcrR family transcriptional regulator [Nocardiopsis coralli]MBE2997919.1 TetR/AcrR family transcriptional regulator [Nocardiopsis coralli]
MVSPIQANEPTKARRILDATRELVLEHGIRKVTIADIARQAGVGKGTLYLYWSNKEELLLGLFGRELIAELGRVAKALDAEPDLVRPRRLAPLMIRTAIDRPLPRHLHAGDVDTLRLLAHNGATSEVFARAAPSALAAAVLGVLRRHGLVRTDRPEADQALALHALLIGFLDTRTDARAAFAIASDIDPEEVMADAVGLLLEPARPATEASVHTAAAEVLSTFDQVRANIAEHLASLENAPVDP